VSSKRAIPHFALAITLPAADTERVQRELETDTALWIDRAASVEDGRRLLRPEHDVVVLGVSSLESLQQAAATLRSLVNGRDRRLPALAVLSAPAPPDASAPGVEIITEAPLSAGALRRVLALAPDPPCPHAADDGLADLADEYLSSRRADVEALQRDLEKGDFTAVAERAHRFKGTGAVYGFPQISMAGAGIEVVARRRRGPEARTWIRALALHLEGLGRERKRPGDRD
jgi:HPt (histidine-containing phosphotransfer) domain-containing protein